TRGVRRIGGRDGDADARADPHAHGAEDEGLLETGQKPSGNRRGIGRVGVHQEDAELIAAEPNKQIRASKRTGESRTDLLQKIVTGRMAERIIDLLEM